MSVANFRADERGDSLENELRNSLRRDNNLRRAPESQGEAVSTGIEQTLERVADLSLTGIDELVIELQALRARLADEGERVRHAVAEYALLSQSSMQSTKVIAESLAYFKHAFDLRNQE
jgi:hypothetical protein